MLSRCHRPPLQYGLETTRAKLESRNKPTYLTLPIPKRDKAQEDRITMEIVVDCYNESEAWSGWRCYLDGKLACPFEAECIRERRASPLKMGERVTVTGMLDDDEAADSLGEMQVEIAWQGRILGVRSPPAFRPANPPPHRRRACR